MKFTPTAEALARATRRGQSLKATANWTVVRRRYRHTTETEASAIADLHSKASMVVRDEGLLFVKDGDGLYAYTLSELGIPENSL